MDIEPNIAKYQPGYLNNLQSQKFWHCQICSFEANFSEFIFQTQKLDQIQNFFSISQK